MRLPSSPPALPPTITLGAKPVATTADAPTSTRGEAGEAWAEPEVRGARVARFGDGDERLEDNGFGGRTAGARAVVGPVEGGFVSDAGADEPPAGGTTAFGSTA